MKSDILMQRVSQTLAIGTFIICLVVPLITWRLLRKINVDINEFKKVYGPLVEDQTIKTKISKYWNQVKMLRWFLVTVVLVVCKDFSA
jgi:anaerobic C4-dicarboxylate transporter